jgi:DNA-binding PadR family transcriptional regulator
MPRKTLSAMEFTVLGIAWKRGPCTTYALMKELGSSTSTYYKSRAGTAYPLVDRLIKMGLLAMASGTGARNEKLVSVTEAGEQELRRWLAAPIGLDEVAHTMDFVRLRVFYLGAATREERAAVLHSAIRSLEEHLQLCSLAAEKYAAMGDAFSTLATEGVMHETKARLEWLRSIRSRALEAEQGKPGEG